MTNKLVAGMGVALTLILAGAGCSSGSTTTKEAQQNTFSKEAMVGIWRGDITGADVIELRADGTFTSIISAKEKSAQTDDELVSDLKSKEGSNGTWEVDGTNLVLHDPIYVTDGTLENATLNGNTFTGFDKNMGEEYGHETWTRIK